MSKRMSESIDHRVVQSPSRVRVGDPRLHQELLEWLMINFLSDWHERKRAKVTAGRVLRLSKEIRWNLPESCSDVGESSGRIVVVFLYPPASRIWVQSSQSFIRCKYYKDPYANDDGDYCDDDADGDDLEDERNPNEDDDDYDDNVDELEQGKTK